MDRFFTPELPPEFECDAERLSVMLTMAIQGAEDRPSLFEFESMGVPDPDQYVMFVGRTEMDGMPTIQAWSLRADRLWDKLDDLTVECGRAIRQQFFRAMASAGRNQIAIIADGADDTVAMGVVRMPEWFEDLDPESEDGINWPESMMN